MAKLTDGRTTRGGATIHFSRFPFASIVRVTNCVCEDGKRRTVTITGTADTFFSIPGKVQYKGKTVSGFVTYDDNDEPLFTSQGKNAHLIKKG